MKKKTNILLLLSALFLSACGSKSIVVDVDDISFKKVETKLSEVLDGADTKFFQNEKYSLNLLSNISNNQKAEIRGILDLNKKVSKRSSSLYVKATSGSTTKTFNYYVKDGRLYSSEKDEDNDKALDYDFDDYFLATKVGLDIFSLNEAITNTIALFTYAPESDYINVYEGSGVYKVNIDFDASKDEEWGGIVGNVLGETSESMDYEMNFYFKNKRLFAVNIDMNVDEKQKLYLDFAQTNDKAVLDKNIKDYKDTYAQNHFKFVYHILGEKHVYHSDDSGYPSYIDFKVPGQKQVDYYKDSDFKTKLKTNEIPKFNKNNETDIYVKFNKLPDKVDALKRYDEAAYVEISRFEEGDNYAKNYKKIKEFIVNNNGNVYNTKNNEYFIKVSSSYYRNLAYSMDFGLNIELKNLTWKKAGSLFISENKSYFFIYEVDKLTAYAMVDNKYDFTLTFTDEATDSIKKQYDELVENKTVFARADNLSYFYAHSVPKFLNEETVRNLLIYGEFTSGPFYELPLSKLIDTYVTVETRVEGGTFFFVIKLIEGSYSREYQTQYIHPSAS